jgi:hypothetical protein
MFIATTTCSILRGTYQTEDDDEADSSQPAATGVPASLVQQTKFVASPETGRSAFVEYVTGLLKPGTDCRKGDRLLDEKTKLIYTVDSVVTRSVLMPGDVELGLRLLDS